MKERLEFTWIVFVAVLLFVSLVFLFIIWIPIWIITNWSYPDFVAAYFKKHRLD